MRRSALLLGLLLATIAPACEQSGPTTPENPAHTRLSNFDTGIIVVFVHWEAQGIPGKLVELVGTDRSELTDGNGLARFRVSAGAYTVRVHDLNRGGPPLRYLDFKVSVDPYQQEKIDVIDCLPCV